MAVQEQAATSNDLIDAGDAESVAVPGSTELIGDVAAAGAGSSSGRHVLAQAPPGTTTGTGPYRRTLTKAGYFGTCFDAVLPKTSSIVMPTTGPGTGGSFYVYSGGWGGQLNKNALDTT